ncbi:restriction endonuclease subunit S, partial [Stutzerimonas balearica]|uniref:restriction endonuclease subunit S n=1 Tax=Stutzerimonas balearica TaxID=74829 RepID=UPI0028AFDB7B
MSYTSLADICCDVSYGYTESATSEAVGPKFLRITDIQGGMLDWNKVPYCPATDANTKKYALEIGDIVIARTGNSTGENTQLSTEPPPAVFASYLIRFRPDASRVNPFFVGYQLRSERFRQYVLAVRSGSAQPGANAKQLGSFTVELIDRALQDEAVEILRALDDRITLLRETNATLEAIAQALFKSWFVDFDPVRAKAEGRARQDGERSGQPRMSLASDLPRPGAEAGAEAQGQPEAMDATTAALFPDSFEESELGLVPKGWRIERAEQWLSVLETGRRPKGGVSGILDGVPSIGAESIVRIGEFEYSKTKYVSAEFFEKMKSGALQSHDVLLYKDGGKPGVFLPRVSMFGDGFPFEECGINEHVFRVRLKEPFSQAFLYYWLWSDAVMHELKHRGGKAAIPGINQSDVKELRLLVPNEQILKSFDEVTKPLISRIFANSKQAQTLTQLRDTRRPQKLSATPDLSGTVLP